LDCSARGHSGVFSHLGRAPPRADEPCLPVRCRFMANVVVVGDGAVARLAHFYLENDSPHDVVAFTLDGERIRTETLQGLPLVPLEDVPSRYPPGDFSMFVAVGYGRMNKLRESLYIATKSLGYELITYLSSKATAWSSAEIGDNCFIMEQTVIQPFASIGNDVILWSGCHINHDTVINDHCFFSSDVVVAGVTNIGPNCFLGLGATISNGLTIARECVIGAGSVIMKDTKPREVYAGSRSEPLPIPSDRLPPSALTGLGERATYA
jgi:sugar O-acyltransferase (sialic acid O-acetyltransferase NeuD family)